MHHGRKRVRVRGVGQHDERFDFCLNCCQNKSQSLKSGEVQHNSLLHAKGECGGDFGRDLIRAYIVYNINTALAGHCRRGYVQWSNNKVRDKHMICYKRHEPSITN